MIRLSLRSNKFMFTICRKFKSKECRMSGNFSWVCICILEGGHFSFLNANALTTGLALITCSVLGPLQIAYMTLNTKSGVVRKSDIYDHLPYSLPISSNGHQWGHIFNVLMPYKKTPHSYRSVWKGGLYNGGRQLRKLGGGGKPGV